MEIPFLFLDSFEARWLNVGLVRVRGGRRTSVYGDRLLVFQKPWSGGDRFLYERTGKGPSHEPRTSIWMILTPGGGPRFTGPMWGTGPTKTVRKSVVPCKLKRTVETLSSENRWITKSLREEGLRSTKNELGPRGTVSGVRSTLDQKHWETPDRKVSTPSRKVNVHRSTFRCRVTSRHWPGCI